MVEIRTDLSDESDPDQEAQAAGAKPKAETSLQKPPGKRSGQPKPSRKLRNPQKRFSKVLAG